MREPRLLLPEIKSLGLSEQEECFPANIIIIKMIFRVEVDLN